MAVPLFSHEEGEAAQTSSPLTFQGATNSRTFLRCASPLCSALYHAVLLRIVRRRLKEVGGFACRHFFKRDYVLLKEEITHISFKCEKLGLKIFLNEFFKQHSIQFATYHHHHPPRQKTRKYDTITTI